MGAMPIEYYTYQDYKKWEGDWELIEGIPYAMSPAPVKKHQGIAYSIARELGNNLKCPNCEVLGEVDYKVNNDTILKPDVVLTCDDFGVEALIKAPEIVFEVISPSTARRDEVYKFDIYQKEGVKYYILVYPDTLVAKIYKNENGIFKKVGDFSKDKFKFDVCDVEVDFDEVFKRYR